MKTIRFSLLLFLATTSLTFTSCSKDDAKDANDETSGTYVKFTIDNTNYEFVNPITAESLAITVNANNGEGLTNVGDTQIAIWLPVEPVVGTYDVVGAFEGDHKVSFSSEPMGFDFDFATNGSITITEVSDKFISGTFTGTVTSDDVPSITIANGEFKADIF